MSEEFLERIRSAKDHTPESINFDSSEELRKANDLALDPSTVESGILKLEHLIASHPDASDPYCLLAQALSKQKKYQDAERILLDAYDRVKRKSNVADSLGYFYLQETTQKNLAKSVEWYLVSIAAQRTKPSLWAPFLYLSGVYQEYGLTEIASSLKQAASTIRKNPVHLSEDWFRNLGVARKDVDDHSIRFLLEKGWDKGIAKTVRAILNQDSVSLDRATQASANLVCDVCARPVTGQGKRYSAGQFKALVHSGFQPDAEVARMMGTRMGVGDSEALHLWRSVLVPPIPQIGCFVFPARRKRIDISGLLSQFNIENFRGGTRFLNSKNYC